MNPRAAAARIVAHVTRDGLSLRRAIPEAVRGAEDVRDAAFAQALAYESLRWWLPLKKVAHTLLDKPLRRKDADVQALLCIGAYQLLAATTERHAAVNETADAARQLGKPWAVGLVNGVLRTLSRTEHHSWPPPATDAHPGWLRRRLKADWGSRAADVMAANQQPPPMWLRVNRRLGTAREYAQRLESAGLGVARRVDDALQLAQPVPVSRLPDFGTGAVSVQDRAAQLAVAVVDPKPGDRVLDACAAPGGKTAHLAETEPALKQLTALDIDPERVALARETLQRLGLQADLRTADATDVESWWDGEPFDKILLDAPCSATGVIRRHPDIRLLRKPADLPKLADRQIELLSALWPTLRSGGRLIYATCSVLHQENDQVVEVANTRLEACSVASVPGAWGEATAFGRRIQPGDEGMDGFYYACLRKS